MSFPLIGNERLKATVERLIEKDVLPHALIIEGEEGSGRRTLGRYIAKAATCKGENKPCEVCDSCRLNEANTHPDIVFTAPEKDKKSIVVDQIRALRSQVFVKAHISNRRVFIIERADTMNPQAQNALLKVLEEPPRGVIFILIAASRSALLETIVSRCVTLSVALPQEKEAKKYIKATLNAEDEKIEDALSRAFGSIGKAIELLGSRKKGEDYLDKAAQFMEAFAGGREWDMLKLLAPFEKDRIGTELFISALKLEVAKHMKLSKTIFSAKRYNDFYEELCSYEELLKTNVNLPLLFSNLVCKAKQLN